MSRFFFSLALGSLACLAANSALAADWWNEFKNDIHQTTHRNMCWPRPFLKPDRAAVRAPLDAMTLNGWRRQNLLGAHHFNEDATALTKAGELKVYWILTQAPPRYRTVFVSKDRNANVTANRLDTVQRLAVELVPEGALPCVQATHVQFEGRPALEVDRISGQFQESAPVPILPGAGGSDSDQ